MNPPPVTSRPIAGLPGSPANRRLRFAAATPPRTGPLTWAQRHMLMLIESLQPHTQSVNIPFSFRLRPGVTETEVLDAIRDLIETFDALRTVYLPPPEGPAQRVLQAGEVLVTVIEAETGASAAAEKAAGQLASVSFDIAGEWPLRIVVVTTDGQPRQLVFVACHLVVDLASAEWIRYHLRALLVYPPAETRLPETFHQPLDEVEWERSPAGQRHAERALAEHARTYRAMPQTMLPRPAAGFDGARYPLLRLDSRALAMAVAMLARRHQVSPAAVMCAGICAITGFVSGLDRAFVQLTVGNRITARTRFAVGIHVEDVPVCVDLTGADVGTVITRAGAAIVQAARFGQYPPDELLARRHDIEIDRGIVFDLSCWLNYRTVEGRRTPRTDGVTAQTLAEAAERTRWEWVRSEENSTSSYFVFVDDAGDIFRVSLLFDAALLPPDEAIAWLRGTERLLCAAATRDVPMADIGAQAGLAPLPRSEDWCLTEGGWAHLPSVADLIRRVAGTPQAGVFPAPAQDADGHRLIAFLNGEGTPRDIDALHVSCMDGLRGSRTAVAPHRYVVCAGAPADPGDLAAWRLLPVLAESTGRATGIEPARPAWKA